MEDERVFLLTIPYADSAFDTVVVGKKLKPIEGNVLQTQLSYLTSLLVTD